MKQTIGFNIWITFDPEISDNKVDVEAIRRQIEDDLSSEAAQGAGVSDVIVQTVEGTK